MEQFVGYLVKNLVEAPNEVKIACREDKEVTIVEVRVASADAARVIGRGGRTIQALRTVVMAAAARLQCRVRIDLVD